jgi:hypothetical protein
MDRVSFNILVPILLCVIIAGVIDAAYFEKNSPSTSVDFNGEGVYSNDPEILFGSIPICVNIMHGEKDSQLIFAENIDLLADKYL